jgi:hypothetical protein
VNLSIRDAAANLTFEDVAAALVDQSNWIYAKTMPECPHHYTLRKHWKADVPFEGVVQYIRDHGYREKFGRSYYTRLDINNLKYWSMGAPLPATILINRAEIDRPEPYDAIAPLYDDMWSTPTAEAENRAVIDALGYRGGSVLDVGCGSGLFLDYVEPDAYLGIDPSAGMLASMKAKHPHAETIQARFEAFYSGARRFDLIVGLFAAPSYIEPAAFSRLRSLLAPGGRYFLMFYRDGYEPETHKAAGLEIPFYNWRHAAEHLPDTRVSTLGNFRVLEGS